VTSPIRTSIVSAAVSPAPDSVVPSASAWAAGAVTTTA